MPVRLQLLTLLLLLGLAYLHGRKSESGSPEPMSLRYLSPSGIVLKQASQEQQGPDITNVKGDAPPPTLLILPDVIAGRAALAEWPLSDWHVPMEWVSLISFLSL